MIPHFTQRRLIVLTVTLLSLLGLAFAFGGVMAQDEPGFTPTYRNWTRTSVAHISSNEVFENPELNPAGADLTGFLTIYANDVALADMINGNVSPFSEGAVIVAESTTMTALGETGVSLEAEPRATFWMIKDPDAPEEALGWRWELWTVEDGEDVNAGLDLETQIAACVVCHITMLDAAAAASDGVFSSFTDIDHAEAYLASIEME